MHTTRAVLLALCIPLVLPALCDVSSQAQEQPGAKPEQPKHVNRLAKETSPYLLLHAHNPVDWYPWGEEALKRAKEKNKLIFLSIGYSSCYWCHVMERESFSDEQIAEYLNEHFVCIKVDREERPDIDEIYMAALQAITRQGGGWPLSMFLAPDANPIAGGTYFPPRSTEGRPGFLDVLKQVQEAWGKDPEAVLQQSQQLATHVRQSLRQRPVVLGQLNEAMLQGLLAELGREYDAEHGGFGYSDSEPKRPKFPEPSNLVFLLDHVRRHPDDASARTMLVHTLDKMAEGGIRDHLGGGFHRYSTDRFWHVPHFEKMLYDNGQLASVYAEAYALTQRKEYRRVAEGIVDFVLRELRDDQGGFYSALDAETGGEEGKYYVWLHGDLTHALSEEEMALLSHTYGLGAAPNFEEQYVLLQREPPGKVAKDRELTEDELDAQLVPIRAKLLAIRDKRPRPRTDTKILASWNGLMIAGLADTGRILHDERCIQAAEAAAQFILEHLVDDQGRLKRSYGGGQARLNAFLDDYALMVQGLIALHRATGADRWLEAADRLTAKQIELFWDDRAGGFFFTSHDHEALFARSKDPADGVIPAGNSVSASNLLYLADQLKRPEYRRRAEETLRTAIPLLDGSPLLVPRMAVALAELLDSGK